MPAPDLLQQWHRWFGLALTDLFSGTPWRVELEKELGQSSQVLDVAIIARAEDGPVPAAERFILPDGLEGLRAHNLVTYKSQHEALNGWALDELIGYYVSYRKASRIDGRLRPEADYGLYAAAARFPRDLAARVEFRATARRGIFDIPWGTRHIRLVVLGEIDSDPRNAPWHLFSARTDRFRAGVRDYRPRDEGVRALLSKLYFAYRLELPDMPYTMEQFIRETREEIFESMTAEERRAFLAKLPAEEVVNRLSTEERLRGLDPEDRLRGLDPEERLRGLDPEERLRGLNTDELLRLRARLDKLN